MRPESPAVERALDQCDRLELAINQFHAEGLRFAAFTLLRMVFGRVRVLLSLSTSRHKI
jgi:hypothetical protein